MSKTYEERKAICDRAYVMHQSGYTCSEIAAQLKIPESNVRAIVKVYDKVGND